LSVSQVSGETNKFSRNNQDFVSSTTIIQYLYIIIKYLDIQITLS